MEWHIDNLVFSKKTFDFRDAGQDLRNLTQIVADGVVVINMVERLSVIEKSMQVSICERCGIQKCKRGAWLAPRKWKERILLIPVPISEIVTTIDQMFYTAPDYVLGQGFPSITFDGWEQMRELNDDLLSLVEIEPFSCHDLLCTIQYFAPGKVLGEQGKVPNLDLSNIVAVSEGELEIELATFEQLIDKCLSSCVPVINANFDRRIKFFLDIAGHIEWTPLEYSDEKPRLNPYCVLKKQ